MNEITIERVEGEARILDTDLATRLGFDRPRKIRDLIKRYHPDLLKMGPCPTVERVINGGETTEFYLNRKQAIFITAKSDTPDATEITIEVIERFDAYEKGAAVSAIPDLSDPLVLQHLLAQHITARIAADQRAAVAEKAVEAAQETVDAHNRIADAEGTLCITDAAKVLGVPRDKLFRWLRAEEWIFQRGGKDHAYQPHLANSDLMHRVYVQTMPDGIEKARTDVRVTMSGLSKLAKRVPGAKPVAQIDLFHKATHKVPTVTM